MKDERKTKKQLIEELEEWRGQQDPFSIHLRQAVEQVRAKAMSMRHSEDLLSLVGVMFEEVQRLGLDSACPTVVFLNQEADDCAFYNSFQNPAQLGISWTSPDVVAYSDEIVTHVGGRQSYSEWLRGEAGRGWQKGTAWVDRFFIPEEHARETAESLGLSRPVLEWTTREVLRASVPFEHGLLKLAVWGDEPHLMEVAQALTGALSLGYVRFLDLVHLEEQNRQLEIEQILERVRGQALGMHQSEDLTTVAATVFAELRSLDLAVWRCGWGIFNDECRPPELELWYTTAEGDVRRTVGTYRIDEEASSLIREFYLAWKRGEEHHCRDLGGSELKNLIMDHLIEERGLSLPEWGERRPEDLPERLWFDYLFFPHGFLQVTVLEPLPGEILSVLKQLAAIFGVAYSRFLELQLAEVHARQAERRAAVDRVRAEIATMRTSADLEHLTPLIWKELTDAGVSFFRCGVFIAAEEGRRVQTYLTNPQGESLGVLDLGDDSHPFIGRVLESWRAAQGHIEQWDQPTFLEWMDFLQAQGQDVERGRYLDAGDPPESLSLQFVPFAQGMLYVGSAAPLPEEDLSLVQEVATAFSVAYARYLDFEQLEEQNRNLEVEQALERVRTQVAAMQESGDLFGLAARIHAELGGLGLECEGICINVVRDGVVNVYDPGGVEGQWSEKEAVGLTLPFFTHWREARTWQRYWSFEATSAAIHEWQEKYTGLSFEEARAQWKGQTPREGRTIVDAPFSHGTLAINRRGDRSFSDDDITLLERFTEVFALGYTRYLDLQAAEERAAQSAREVAYERVRSAVLASRNAEDILQVASLMQRELRGLGVRLEDSGINVIDEEAGVFRRFDTLVKVGAPADPTPLDRPEVADVVARWRKNECHMRHMQREQWRERDLEHARNTGGEDLVRHLQGLRVVIDVPFTYGTLAMNSTEVDEFSEEEIAILQGFADVISMAYTRYLDLSAIEEAQRQKVADLEEELQDARRMQMGLMPAGPPDVAGMSIAGRCVSANDVSGDFYQYFEGEVGLTVSLADVTGHAMEAAIPAVMFSGILDTRMEEPKPLPELFQSLNRSLCRSLDEHTYVCLSMLDLDPVGHEMRVANCGCPYPLHYHADADQIEEIRIEAYPLGIRPDTEYAAKEVSLSPGDYVVLHSDGFSEAANAEEQLFGFDRTMEVIRQGCSEGLSPEELIDRLIGEVKAFTGDEPQADDMTCVVVKVEA